MPDIATMNIYMVDIVKKIEKEREREKERKKKNKQRWIQVASCALVCQLKICGGYENRIVFFGK